MDDVSAMYAAYTNGLMIDTKTFTVGVSTGEGTYLLKIEDLSKFQTWGAEKFGTSVATNPTISEFDAAWQNLKFIYPNGKASELALLNKLQNSGLLLFKGNAGLTSWQAIKKEKSCLIH